MKTRLECFGISIRSDTDSIRGKQTILKRFRACARHISSVMMSEGQKPANRLNFGWNTVVKDLGEMAERYAGKARYPGSISSEENRQSAGQRL